MKKLMMLAVAAVFSVSAAAYACDGMKAKTADGKTPAAKVAKEVKKPATNNEKKS
jgi:hypothetical protein